MATAAADSDHEAAAHPLLPAATPEMPLPVLLLLLASTAGLVG
jgi:hypothetical protein